MKLTRGKFECMGCGENFQSIYSDDKPKVCPHCKSGNINCICEEPAHIQAVSTKKEDGCGCGCKH